MKRKSVFFHLRRHIEKNYVLAKVGSNDRVFRQMQGIPQGSVLSTILCNLYYGDIETKHINPQVENMEDGVMPYMLVRLVDDFLYITHSSSACEKFPECVKKALEDNGGKINLRKMKRSDSTNIWVEWCGYKINSKHLWIRMDYSKLKCLRDIYSTFTTDFSGKAFGESALRYLRSLLAQKCDPLLFDSIINAESNSVYNLVQVTIFLLMRLHICVTRAAFSNTKFLSRIFQVALYCMHSLIQTRTNHCNHFTFRKMIGIAIATAETVFKRYKHFQPILAMLTVNGDMNYAGKYRKTIKQAAKELYF